MLALEFACFACCAALANHKILFAVQSILRLIVLAREKLNQHLWPFEVYQGVMAVYVLVFIIMSKFCK